MTFGLQDIIHGVNGGNGGNGGNGVERRITWRRHVIIGARPF